MASLNSAAKKLKKEKSLLSKIRRSSEREFNKVQAISRKSSSSLTSVQKRIDSYREQAENIGQILNQKIIQLESVQRLKDTAAEKLGLEKQNTEQLEDESKYVSTKEEKQSIESQLNIIHGVIDDIKNELKQRKSMEKKLLQAIDEYTKSKSKVSTKIKNNLVYRSKLAKLVKTSQSNVDRVGRKFNLTKSREDSANKRLGKITSQLYEILRKRGKAKPKVKRGKAKPKVKKKTRR